MNFAFEQQHLTAGARGCSGSKAGSFRQCRQRCDGPQHAAHQHLLQEQIRLQRGAQGRSKKSAYLLVCLLTELFSDVLCLLTCCASGSNTMTHHSCEYVQRLLCNASGTNSCDSVIAVLCFSIMLSMEGWRCSRLLKCMLHAIACVQTQSLLITAVLTFQTTDWLLDSKCFMLNPL